MSNLISEFIRVRHIDSFQKLRFLLFLQQHPDLSETGPEFAAQLYLGDTRLLEEIIRDLEKAGLVDCEENRCRLHHQPEIHSCLRCLARAFEDPLARQTILDQVRHYPTIK